MTRLISCIFLFWSLLLSGQSNAELLSTDQGLSQGMVFDILQSRSGFLWVATKDGLNRYDGYRFNVFLPDPFDPFSIGANEIRSIYEDTKERLWLSYEGGIDLFLPEEGLFFHLKMDKDFDYGGYINSIQEDKDGSIWVVCNGYLWHIKLDESTLHIESGAYPKFSFKKIYPQHNDSKLKDDEYISLLPSKSGLIANTRFGLFEIVNPSSVINKGLFTGNPSRELTLLGGSPNGIFYAYGGNAIWRIDENYSVSKEVNISADKSFYIDANNHLWAHDGRTIFKWKFGDQSLEPILSIDFSHSFEQMGWFYFTSFFIDQSDIAWMGTSGYGLLKIPTVKPKFRSYMPLISQRQLIEDPNGEVFSIRKPDKLFAHNDFSKGRTNTWLADFSSEDPIIYFLFDKEGNGWCRSYYGKLYFVDKETRKKEFVNLSGIGLWIDRNNKLYSLTENALLSYDPLTQQTRVHQFGVPLKLHYNVHHELTLFFEDNLGKIWIKAFEGLVEATPVAESFIFKHYTNNPDDRNSLSNNYVLCIAEDPMEPDRYLWLGTKGGGLNRLDRQTGSIVHFSIEHGLPDRVIYGILPDNEGSLWMSTNKGLCRLRQEGTSFSFKKFTPADGLQSSEFNQSSFLRKKDGTLLFGGVNGLTVFHPDSLQFRNTAPLTHIVALKAGNESFSRSTFLKLKYNQSLLVFEFASLDFSNPSQNQYRYQLIRRGLFGVETIDGWIDLGTLNSVQLANLRPGNYRFRVIGSNDEGTWSMRPDEMQFIILPPFWATWWASLCYVILITIGFFIFYRYRLARRMEQQEALRLKELDEFKNRFFTNITHEFRTPLAVILGMAEQVETHVHQDIKPKISLIRRSGQNLLRLINQILDLAKLENDTLKIHYLQGDVLPYLRYIVESLHSLASAKNIILQIESDQLQIVMDYDPERLLQIVHNLLSNAIKFTSTGGSVVLCVDIKYIENLPHLIMSVSDTGAGIPSADLPYIFDRFYQVSNLEKEKAGGTGIGLALTRELVKAMQGDIFAESEPGKGSTFTVKLPITNNALESDPAIWNLSMPVKGNTSIGITNSPNELKLESTDELNISYVLIIEDNPDVVEYLTACLSWNRSGASPYRLDFAYNGRIGIEKALETVPDMIISDVMMPEKDGFEVCETLKNDERTSHIPIVLLTAKVGVENRITGLRRGADAYLDKPFHQEELLATLANLLEIRKKLQARYASSSLNPSSSQPSSHDPEDAFVAKVKSTILEHISETEFNVEALCRVLVMSRPQLHRKLTALTGMNSTQYIRSLRLARAKELLQRRGMNVSEVAYAVGFDDPKYFSRVFTEEFGVAPSKI